MALCMNCDLDLTLLPDVQHNTLDGPMPMSRSVFSQPGQPPRAAASQAPRPHERLGGRALSESPANAPAAPRTCQGIDAAANAAAASVAAAVAAVAGADTAPAAAACDVGRVTAPHGAIVDSASAPAAARLRPEVQVMRRSVYDSTVPSREELDQMTFIQKVQSVYHRPISEAAQVLDMGVTVLKKQCRDQGIARWPFRKLQSIDKLIQSVQSVRCAHFLVAKYKKQLCLVCVSSSGDVQT